MSHSTFKMPSAAKIAEWKKQFKQLHKITPDATRPDIFCIVRHPNMLDIIASSDVGGADDFLTGKSQLIDCWLDGDDRIKTDPELLKAAAVKMGYIFQLKTTRMEYLSADHEIVIGLLNDSSIPSEAIARVKAAGELRKLTVVLDVNAEGEETTAVAYLFKPELIDFEKASTGANFSTSGMIYYQECLITCDDVLKDNSDDEVMLSVYLCANAIFRNLAANVEKL